MELEDNKFDDIICTTIGNQYFDAVIGHIEDIVLSGEFEGLKQKFLENNWQTVENTEENKLEYFDVFKEYTSVFENHLMKELNERMPGFDMERFAKELNEYNALSTPQDNGEIFELLHSFTNFQAFKEIILDYRYKMEGNSQHFSFDFLTTKPLGQMQHPHAP